MRLVIPADPGRGQASAPAKGERGRSRTTRCLEGWQLPAVSASPGVPRDKGWLDALRNAACAGPRTVAWSTLDARSVEGAS